MTSQTSCFCQSLDCLGHTPNAAAELWRVLIPDGMLVCVSCRSPPLREESLKRWFTALNVREVWSEGPRAPCATYCITVFQRRRDVQTDDDGV